MLNVLIPAYSLSTEKLKKQTPVDKYKSPSIIHPLDRKENSVNVWKHKVFDFCATQWLCQNYKDCESANKSCFYSGV